MALGVSGCESSLLGLKCRPRPQRLVKIGEAAKLLGTTPDTLRKWEASGELLPARKTKGGTRYYAVADLLGLAGESSPTVCYARVSSDEQKEELDRQHAMLEAYCAAKGWKAETIKDLGSGMNDRKKGLNRLLELILRGKMRRLVITHKDRLLRFGAELIFTLCEIQGIEIVIIHKGEPPSFGMDPIHTTHRQQEEVKTMSLSAFIFDRPAGRVDGIVIQRTRTSVVALPASLASVAPASGWSSLASIERRRRASG
nr:IS607 family transposase [Nitrosococcus halophilus]